ncbi:MAG: hypothetical protein CM15mV122_110 [uncultured marine virus]|nr:MAG: hypothetical protein CM15mV122_110 [uncultured marine virus]
MGCAVTNGRSLPCKSNVGGIKFVFIAPILRPKGSVVDTDGDVTLDGSVNFLDTMLKATHHLNTNKFKGERKERHSMKVR